MNAKKNALFQCKKLRDEKQRQDGRNAISWPTSAASIAIVFSSGLASCPSHT